MTKVPNAVLALVTLFIIASFAAALWFAFQTRATQSEVRQKATYERCDENFPFRDDLQEACRLGADLPR